MEESRQSESFSSFLNVSGVAYNVRDKVELCIQNYMSLDVTAKYLEKTHRISKSVTHIVWEQLREENPVFFSHFEMRCQMALQMRMFNDMLTKQAVGMFENGLLDICDASPSVKALLRQQHPERVHILETIASKKKLSSAGLVALPYANGPSDESFTNSVAQTQFLYNQQEQVNFAMPNPSAPSVVQSQNHNDQQNQVLNPTTFAMPNPRGPLAAQWQIPNEQLNQHLYASSLAFSDANVTQLPIPYDQQEQQDQHLYTTNLPLPYANGPSAAQWQIPNEQLNQHLYASSLAFSDANVTQLPIPYDQQDQHLYTTNLPLPYANGPSVTQLPIPNNQQTQPHQDPLPTYNNDIISPIIAPADTDVWLQHIDPSAFADLGVLPPLPPADTTNPGSLFDISWTDAMPEEPSILELGGDIMDLNEQQQHLDGQCQPHCQQQQQNVQVEGNNGDELLCNNFDITPPVQTDTNLHQQQAGGGVYHHHPVSEALNNPDSGVIGHNGPSDSYIITEAQLVMQPSEQPQDLNGHYQQPQQNVSVETVQRGGRSNGVVNGESNEKSHSKRMCTTSVDQPGRVKRPHPEPETALNNLSSGTQTTGVEQQRSPKARATTRSLKEWEQYESEETKQ